MAELKRSLSILFIITIQSPAVGLLFVDLASILPEPNLFPRGDAIV